MERVDAKDWYEIKRIDDDITLIGEPHIKRFFRCNIWHVRGRDRDLLIDSGMGVVSLREHVPLVTERPLVAVTSHTHYDHIGSHHEFEDRCVHHAEAGLMADPDREKILANYVRDEIFTGLPPKPFTAASYGVRAAPATCLLDDGDIVGIGDRHFEVIHTPGHSPGGIALWEAATGILFSGDIVYDGPLIDDLYHSDIDDYIASMRRLLTLPVRVVHGGHFPSFDGTRYRKIIKDWLRDKGV